MAEKAAIVTGASSGIGLAIARVLGEEGFGVTMAARRRGEARRRPSRGLQDEGFDVQAVAANVADEDEIKKVVAAHRERYGRLDVLVNNAGVGIGRNRRRDPDEAAGHAAGHQPALDRPLLPRMRRMLREAAGASTRTRWSSTPRRSRASAARRWLSVYSATKHGVVGWTEAMNKELGAEGIKSIALCPAFVDTPMTDFVKEHVAAEDMIRPEDIAESVRFMLRVSPACVVPEIMFVRPGDAL